MSENEKKSGVRDLWHRWIGEMRFVYHVSPFYFIGTNALNVVSGLGSVMDALFGSYVISYAADVVRGAGDFSRYESKMILIFVGMVIAFIARPIHSRLQRTFNTMVGRAMRDRQLQAYLRLSAVQTESAEVKHLVEVSDVKAWNAITNISDITFVVRSGTRFVAAGIVLLHILPIGTFLLILVALIRLWGEIKREQEWQGIYNDVCLHAQRFYRAYIFPLADIRKIQETKLFGVHEYLKEKALTSNTVQLTEWKKYMRKHLASWAISETLTDWVTIFGILPALLYKLVLRSINLQQFTLAYGQGGAFVGGLGGFLMGFQPIITALRDLESLMTLERMGLETQKAELARLVEVPESLNAVSFSDVSFRYPSEQGEVCALNNFSFTFERGKRYAIVGVNGAGKSTLVKLLLGFYAPNDGSVQVNGTDLQQMSLSAWWKKIGVLFQDFNTYQLTVRENVGFGNIEKMDDDHKLQNAIDRAKAGFVSKFDKKFEQQVGMFQKEGRDLSGGQWQRLALARVFFRDPDILILDEPTSAVDALAEQEIFSDIYQYTEDGSKIVILISHRFSTVRFADEILVLEGGKLVENGSHDALIKKNGVYAVMFHAQARGYQ